MAPGERERYRSGIFYLYRDLNLPVTPVATSLGLLWNRRDWRKKPGRAAIEFLPPIETGLDKQTFMRRLEETIETRERPPDRRILRPALHALAARPALAGPGRHRPADHRPSRSALTNTDMPT